MPQRRESLPRVERLHDSREFRRLREEGRRVRGQLVIVNASENAKGVRQFGIITARSFGPAVARNHARRWLREIYRRHKQQLKPNFSIVVIARQALQQATYRQLQTELLELFSAVGALIQRD